MEPFIHTQTEGSVRITLVPSMDLLVAGALKTSIVESFEAAPKVILDASPVERISTACVQVILAAGLYAEDSDQEANIKIENAPPAFISAVDCLGLSKLFENWSTS